LPHEVMAANALMERYPAFHLPPDFIGVVQPDGGYLAAERCIAALLRQAKEFDANVGTGETIQAIEPLRAGSQHTGVRITTDREEIEARTVVVAAGPWLTKVLPNFPAPLHVTRQVMAWFEPTDPTPFAPERFPVFLIESRHGVHYGFPTFESETVKICKHHHQDEIVDAETCDRSVSIDDEAAIRVAIADHIPAANGKRADATTCLYTMAPDGDFILDKLPGFPQAIVASPCSGHGFKFAPAIGEIVADLITNGSTQHDISRFSLGRFKVEP
jgi:sarcosine oxidase